MARRFPITTRVESGTGAFRALKNFSTSNYYSTADTVLRAHGATRYTAGAIIAPFSANRGSNTFVWEWTTGTSIAFCCRDGSANGYEAGQDGGVGGIAQQNQFLARAGSGGPELGSRKGAGQGFSDEAGMVGSLNMLIAMLDDDPYPGSGLYVNGCIQEADAVASSGSTTQNLRIGLNYLNNFLEGWLVGFFFHTDIMSLKEQSILMQNIMLAKRIPDVDLVGGGVVPDHIFDVASMGVLGSSAAPATWTSIGGIGGKTLTRSGNLDVVELGSHNFGARM